ncbi:NAD(P)H-dependent glycerol-3-phosphate dehydrogenase [Propionibacteriaceae bacterium Y2011]|uniref:NAD(P)H-dependent glycerol-3-phosphate dehydrogenase n=1 Tax=Microlunatus sp. Y2014 TaxID=3418488 RepID=UPI003B488F49
MSADGAKVTVMGAGSWGTAFALVAADAGSQVTLWARRPELAEQINNSHRNTDYFPDLDLPAGIRAVADPAEAMAGADVVVLAVPSQTLRRNLADWRIDPDVILVSLAKGIEEGTGLRMSELITAATGHDPDRLAVVSGPNLAREIVERQPAATVVASASEATAIMVQRACHTRNFRAYTNTDIVGTELGGAAKNVIALAVGAGIGLGYGNNAMASVITRGLAEITRLGIELGAQEHTFAGLAGMGDLVATCMSPLSRNRTFGEQLAKGRSVADIVATTRQVAEGVRTCESLVALADRHGVDMPISYGVAQVIAGQATPEQMISALLARQAKPERT